MLDTLTQKRLFVIPQTENTAEEKIRTLRPKGKEGVVIHKRVYDMLSFTILSTVCTNQHLTINDLLEKCHQKTEYKHIEVSWVILQIKLDLEAKGLIKSIVPVGQRGVKHIKLTRLGWQQLILNY